MILVENLHLQFYQIQYINYPENESPSSEQMANFLACVGIAHITQRQVASRICRRIRRSFSVVLDFRQKLYMYFHKCHFPHTDVGFWPMKGPLVMAIVKLGDCEEHTAEKVKFYNCIMCSHGEINSIASKKAMTIK